MLHYTTSPTNKIGLLTRIDLQTPRHQASDIVSNTLIAKLAYVWKAIVFFLLPFFAFLFIFFHLFKFMFFVIGKLRNIFSFVVKKVLLYSFVFIIGPFIKIPDEL